MLRPKRSWRELPVVGCKYSRMSKVVQFGSGCLCDWSVMIFVTSRHNQRKISTVFKTARQQFVVIGVWRPVCLINSQVLTG